GLIMEGGDSVAANITGSATKGNVLIGSQFADFLGGGSATDSLVSNGGPDGVNLGGGTSDLLGLYLAQGNAFATPGNAPNGGGFGAIVSSADVAQAGWWSVTPVTATLVPTTAFPNTGTSASMVLVNAGFVVASDTTSDTVDFSTSEWGFNGLNTFG